MVVNPRSATLKRKYNLNEKELLRKFEGVHCRIANHFYCGMGTRLQFWDSQIAESILNHFTKREVPCLGVHDSFLVPEMYKDELFDQMNTNKSYKKKLFGLFRWKC
jgi:hypothetical protein